MRLQNPGRSCCGNAKVCPHTQSSFRGAPLGASPESILPMVVMDSGLAALRRPGMTTGCLTIEYENYDGLPNSRVQNATMSSRNNSASPGRLPILAPLRP
jgi:hypothetical protein